MKKLSPKVLSLMLSVLLILATYSPIGFADTTFNATSGLDLTEYAQNAGRIYFDSKLIDSNIDVTIASVQALNSGDENFNAEVVNGVKNGIKLDGKTVAEWNEDGPYGIMVHFYIDGSESFIAVYADASLVNFFEGETHTIELTSDFKNYFGNSVVPATFTFDVASKTWTKEVPPINATEAISFPDNPDWGNFMIVNFDDTVATPPGGADVIANIETMEESNPLYDANVVNAVKTKVFIENQSVQEWLDTGIENAVQIHMGANDIRIYMEPTLVLFNDGDVSVEIGAGFKTLSGKTTPSSAKFYYSSEDKTWSTDSPLPIIEIDEGVSYPDNPEWGNFMGVMFKEDICPEDILTDGLITNVQNMTSADPNYNSDVVTSALEKIVVNNKTIAQWLELDPDAANIHMGQDSIRIYMKDTLVAFADGDTHNVTILKGFITFTGKRVGETIALNYDPTANLWTTEEVTPPAPPAGAAVDVFSITDLLVNADGFANVYFYLTDIINRLPSGTINVQAGGGNIPDDVRDSVLDKIKIDGKTVRQWNEENESDYSVMVAYETEGTPQGTFGRLSIWSNVNESTLNFREDVDHTVEFLEGLLGLNYAPINPSIWKYTASEQMWEKLDQIPDEDGEPIEDNGDEDPVPTGDYHIMIAVMVLILSGAIVYLLSRKLKSNEQLIG